MKRKLEILISGGLALVSAGAWMRGGLDAGLITLGIGMLVIGLMLGAACSVTHHSESLTRRRK